jgi:hypothetical protein
VLFVVGTCHALHQIGHVWSTLLILILGGFRFQFHVFTEKSVGVGERELARVLAA